jgi:hypothetical protein
LTDESGEGAGWPEPSSEPKRFDRLRGWISGKWTKHSESRRAESPQDRVARRTATATIWIAGCTAVAAGVGIFQWTALKHTDEKIGEQVKALRRQLDLMEADQRPYLHLAEAKLIRQSPRDPNPSIEYKFFNSGKTAAVLREVNVDCRLSGTMIMPPMYRQERTQGGRSIIGAKSTYGSPNPLKNCQLDTSISADDWAAIEGKTKVIVLFARLKYEGATGATYTKGFGVFNISGTDDFGDINHASYNYENIDRPKPE